jgi:hypothetical protein
MEIVARLPDVCIDFGERQVWVDTAGGRLFVIINGDLLEVPLPASRVTSVLRR